ncbi:EamA family transporter [Agreia sp. PsM10]|uniref:DMT family transporter n=1 Tax=Agreia sp. PsM10 TaxID=3030533 RepID=UPI00263A5792|nr:EamA family transporter [Agreia sp. PsM10]MDN4642065.1 EamA family transporter [Agreia sp. PsM10]
MSSSFRARGVPRGVLYVCTAGILWGTAPIAFDIVHDLTGLGAVQISAYRLVIAALALAVMAVLTGNGVATGRALKRQPLSIAAIGASVATYQALWFAAITQVGVSAATVISLGLAPVLITVWEKWITRTRPRTAQLLSIAAALTGLTLISLSAEADHIDAGSPFMGLLLASASGVLYAATTVLSRRVAVSISPVPMATASTAIGALCLMPLALLSGPVVTTDSTAILSIVYLGVVTMALASLLLYSGLRTAHASTASIATLLEPVTAALLAVVFLAESLSMKALIGIGLILTAVAAMNLGSSPNSPADQK